MSLLLWTFWTYSFFGYLLERGYAAATRAAQPPGKGFLLLPLCPVYGLGALAVLALPPALTDGFWSLALWGGLTATAVEYGVHLLYDRLLGVRFWDYSRLPGNFQGRVCLPFSLAWGLLAAAVLPAAQAALERQQEQEQYERQTAQEREQYERDVQRAQLLAGVGDFSGYSALWGLSDAQTAALVSDYAARQQTSRQEAARELAAFYAEYGDFSGLKALGVDTSYVTQMQSYELADQRRKAAQAASKGSSGSKSSGSGSSGRSSGSGGGSQDYQGLFQAALASGHPKSFIANNYKKYGFTSSSGLYDDFGDWEYEQSRQVPSLSTYQEAAAYLRGQGAPVSGLMTASEWARHKSGGRDTSGAGAYATYQDYLNGYVKGAVG